MVGRFEKFSERARRVLSIAQEEAHRFNHNYIGTEHILLGLTRETDGVAAKVLTDLGAELNKVRGSLEFIIGKGDNDSFNDIGLTPRAKKVIELAIDEARRLRHNYIGTEHLLVGLLREGEGVPSGILESFGITLDDVRERVFQVLNEYEKVSKSLKWTKKTWRNPHHKTDDSSLVAEFSGASFVIPLVTGGVEETLFKVGCYREGVQLPQAEDFPNVEFAMEFAEWIAYRKQT